jgi:hypothetical protein|uniref:DUF1549 domain-containing protein n=1 Tax=Prosthecobacter sp. TaxID=1965333 RepID=UPI0037837959
MKLTLLTFLLPATLLAEVSPSFRQDVMPILFRAGCNAGTCHGAAKGKDGFMLSLFGYDPAGDYHRIVNDIAGRRINPAMPERSLLLLKSLGKVPHTGGEIFSTESPYYRTLLDWIAAGAPDDAQNVPDTTGLEVSDERFVFEGKTTHAQLRVFAHQSDGSKRDVTNLAIYHSNNPAVATIDENGRVGAAASGDTHVFARYSRFAIGASVTVLKADNFVWPNPTAHNYIDKHLFERLQKLRIAPSELCDDETFLRRVTLDLVARPPTPEEYRSFMADTSKDKRTAKIDALLADNAFADLWTSLWGEQLRIMGGGYAPDATHIKAADAFYEWIRRQMRQGRPLNEFVAEMVNSAGSNLSNGPVNLYTMLVHKPQIEPKALAADFSQVFLGVQLQCAECHNHPFDRWNMNDYYGFVSFFTGINRKPGAEPREKRIFWDTSKPPASHLVDGRPMQPKTIGAVEPVKYDGDPRAALAQWLTSPENELFSRNLANRIWAQLMGRGIIHPVDDVRVTNPPVNELLLADLAAHLVASKFSLRSLVRDICASRAYQLSSTPNDTNRRDNRQFSRAYLRRLRADVFIDSVVAVTGIPRGMGNFPEGTRAIDYYPRSVGGTEGPNFGDNVFKCLGRSARGSVSSSETKTAPTISQALHLSVGDTIQPRLGCNGLLQAYVKGKTPPASAIEELFIRCLARKPTGEELTGFQQRIPEPPATPQPYEDLVWALLNSTEFMFNH